MAPLRPDTVVLYKLDYGTNYLNFMRALEAAQSNPANAHCRLSQQDYDREMAWARAEEARWREQLDRFNGNRFKPCPGSRDGRIQERESSDGRLMAAYCIPDMRYGPQSTICRGCQQPMGR
jgi:hypothetical protein